MVKRSDHLISESTTKKFDLISELDSRQKCTRPARIGSRTKGEFKNWDKPHSPESGSGSKDSRLIA